MPPPPNAIEVPRLGRSILGKTVKSVLVVAQPINEEEQGRLRARLSHAGFRGENAVVTYLGVKILFGMLFAAVFLWINSMRAEPFPYLPFITILVLGAGYYLPSLWLNGRIKNRQKQINRGMPDALDLLVTCVESGLGLDAAMNRVADEITLSTPLLAREMLQAALEIRAGSTRADAFRRMAFRTGVEEIRNLSSIIVQTELFGTSIARALRIMSDGMRVRRMQLAEERAATVAVKMTIPLVFCIFPALMAVLLGPAILRMYQFFVIEGGLK